MKGRSIDGLLLAGAIGLCAGGGVRSGFAQEPSWWWKRGVLEEAAWTNDYAAANVGQLKHLAWQAYGEMEETWAEAGGAGERIRTMVSGFWTNRNYRPVNVGQVKEVASAFYDRLRELGVMTNGYPWVEGAGGDYALANVGQLKRVFAFEVFRDEDGDGLPDEWEEEKFGGLSEGAEGDFDEDGADNLGEYLAGTDPTAEWQFPHPVINEVYYLPVGVERSRGQFVELYNPHARALSLERYAIWVGQYNGLAGVAKLKGRIPARGHYLIGGMEVVAVDGRGVDEVVALGEPFLETLRGQTGPVAVVYLWHEADGGRTVDGLAYGRPFEGEITNTVPSGCALPPHEAVPAGYSIARAVDGMDRDRAEDWIGQAVPTPEGSGTAPWFDRNDVDRDGLSVEEEGRWGSDPWEADTDGDGLTDGEEVSLGTKPTVQDTDGDGLRDGWEWEKGLDALKADSDGDGVSDGTELEMVLNPLSWDTDGNGIGDGEEDGDGDGFLNAEEQAAGSAPWNHSSTPLDWDVPVAQWRHPVRRNQVCNWEYGPEPDCWAAWEENREALYDKTYCKISYRRGTKSCRRVYVQDFEREQAYEFYEVSDSVPVFFVVRERDHGNAAGYGVKGLKRLAQRVVGQATTCTLYGAQLTKGQGQRITFVQYMDRAKMAWPDIRIAGPYYLNVRVAGLNGASEENPGLVLFRNGDDDDGDGVTDAEDDWVPGGDEEMEQVSIEYPEIEPFAHAVQLKWDPGVLRVHEHTSKKLHNRNHMSEEDRWIYNADVGACIPNRPYKGYDDGVVYLEGVGTGTTYFTMQYGNAPFRPAVTLGDRVKVTVVDVRMVVDGDRDRVIEEEEAGAVSVTNPVRFWVNDDDDFGDVAEGDSDVPGQGGLFDRANGQDGRVNGRSDLEDFFPVWLDLHEVLKVWPPSKRVKYRLRQGDEAVNVVYTDLTRDRAGAYLTEDVEGCGVGLNESAHEAGVVRVTAVGVDLPGAFLQRIRGDGAKGVMMVEGVRATQEPLVLEIWRDGNLVCERTLPLSLDGVEKMYRYLNLRSICGDTSGGDTRIREPTNYPDSLCSDKYVVFVHGYNESAERARGNIAEVFKRLYWSGNRAKFTGVAWRGNVGATHYHDSVINALATASAFADYLRTLPAEVNVIAFSLGNMVVSSGIQDWSANVHRYFMLHAAVARESYDAEECDDNMRHVYWRDYTNILYASCWYALFPQDDGRNTLTWKGRFTSVVTPELYNFYSSGEDVLQNLTDGGVGFGMLWDIIWGRCQYAWCIQELWKGRCWDFVGGSTFGGWGFSDNHAYYTATTDEYENITWTLWDASTANQRVMDMDLKTAPFFNSNEPVPSLLQEPDDPNGAGSEFARANRDLLLAKMIPALSFATGANPVQRITDWGGMNIDMQGHVVYGGYQNGWPTQRILGWSADRWLHGDYKNVAYVYVYKLFDDIVKMKGRLDQ